MPISKDRVQGYTKFLEQEFKINIVESIHRAAASSEAILLTAVDGRKHLELFKELLPYKLPVFIDKPLALSSEDAQELFSLSKQHNVPIMSSSSLRYADSFHRLLETINKDINSIYVHGPLPMQELMPGYFWYGIHMLEMVIAAMGVGVNRVTVSSNEEYETLILEWTDGRLAVLRGEYEWHSRFGATIHTKHGFYNADITKDTKPFYASLLEQIIFFFTEKTSPVPAEETLEIIRIIEMINKSRNKNKGIP
nr:Gfo/Idh/MocA family oxidoreductase [Mesobacillus harenae]